MSLTENLLLISRFALDARRFDAVWRHQVLPLTNTVATTHPLRRRLLRRMKQHTRVIAGFFGPAIFRLFGESLTAKACSDLGMIGACIPAFDMCFDDNLMELSRLTLLVDEPHRFVALDGVEQLAQNLWNSLMEQVPQPALLLNLTHQMVAIETTSGCQRTLLTSPDDIEAVTREKGGTGGLFFTTALPRLLTTREKQALWLLGAWVQLVDDLFDLPADVSEGIRTPATDALSASQLADKLNQWRTDAFRAVASLQLPDSRKITFLSGFALYDKMAMRYLKQIEPLTATNPLSHLAHFKKLQVEPRGLWKTLFE